MVCLLLPVTELIDYGWQDLVGGTLDDEDNLQYVGYSTEVNSGAPRLTLTIQQRMVLLISESVNPGDLLQLRFDFNVNVQIANTTLEIGILADP